MTAHDPLCWNPQHPHEGLCYGNLSRARADERKRIEKFAIPAWREEIALDIEALMPEPKDHCIEEYNAGLTNAARIARGGTP